MTKVRPSDVLFWLLAMLTLAFLVGFLLILSGAIAIEATSPASESAQTTETEAAEPVAAAPRAEPKAEPKAGPKTETRPEATTTAPEPAQLATVVLTAARGDCWFQARAGSAEGQVLEERLLSQGESISIKSKSVWLTVGAAGNLDVTVNGKPRPLSSGTVSVVLGANASPSS